LMILLFSGSAFHKPPHCGSRDQFSTISTGGGGFIIRARASCYF
jgi:hypothetical protein